MSPSHYLNNTPLLLLPHNWYWLWGVAELMMTSHQWERACGHLTHWGRDKMAVISQTIASSAFSWMKLFNFKWSLMRYVLYGLIDNMTTLVQIIAWRRTGDKPLSEAMLVCFTDIYVTQPQWVNKNCSPYQSLQCVWKHTQEWKKIYSFVLKTVPTNWNTSVLIRVICQGCVLGTFSTLKSGMSPIILTVGAHDPTNLRFMNGNIT